MVEGRWLSAGKSVARELSACGSGAPVPNFTFMTYNVLAQCMLRRDLFPYTSKSDLKKEPRIERILREILVGVKPDIMCLQELDYFESHYRKRFEAAGYAYSYVKKDQSKKTGHGCCILWKAKSFVLRGERQVRFDEPDPKTFTGVCSNSTQPHIRAGVSQIGQLVALQLLTKSDSSASATVQESLDLENRFAVLKLDDDGSVTTFNVPDSDSSNGFSIGLIVANTHLYWTPCAHFERLREVSRMLDEEESFRRELQSAHPTMNSSWPLLFGGDFNSTPTDSAFRVITGQTLSLRQLELLKPSSSYVDVSEDQSKRWLSEMLERCKKAAPLRSVYANYMQLDPNHEVNPNWYAAEMLWPDVHSVSVAPEHAVDLKNSEQVAQRTSKPSVVKSVAEILAKEPEKLQWYGEPSFTVYTAFKGTLDYIFTQPSKDSGVELVATHLLKLPTIERCLNALPNETFGSDHLCLAARFSMRVSNA